jgi:hypothetical protein
MRGKFVKGKWVENPCNEKKMSKTEKYNFIFLPDNPTNPKSISKFDEIAKIPFQDIDFLIESVQKKIKYNKDNRIDYDLSIGINSIPILCFSQIQLITNYCYGIQNQDKSDPNNVEKFIKKFFYEGFEKIPRIIWDGMRNGMMHQFYPKSYQLNANHIKISCYIEDERLATHIYLNNGVLLIAVNSFQFANVCRNAIQNYKKDLESDEELQNCFITAHFGYNQPIDIKGGSDLAKEIMGFLAHSDLIDIRKFGMPYHLQ